MFPGCSADYTGNSDLFDSEHISEILLPILASSVQAANGRGIIIGQLDSASIGLTEAMTFLLYAVVRAGKGIHLYSCSKGMI